MHADWLLSRMTCFDEQVFVSENPWRKMRENDRYLTSLHPFLSFDTVTQTVSAFNKRWHAIRWLHCRKHGVLHSNDSCMNSSRRRPTLHALRDRARALLQLWFKPKLIRLQPRGSSQLAQIGHLDFWSLIRLWRELKNRIVITSIVCNFRCMLAIACCFPFLIAPCSRSRNAVIDHFQDNSMITGVGASRDSRALNSCATMGWITQQTIDVKS